MRVDALRLALPLRMALPLPLLRLGRRFGSHPLPPVFPAGAGLRSAMPPGLIAGHDRPG